MAESLPPKEKGSPKRAIKKIKYTTYILALRLIPASPFN